VSDEFGFISNKEVRRKLALSRDRIGRAYDELLSGYQLKAADVLNDVVQVEQYQGLVSLKDVTFYTFCEHHFLPFFGTADITYLPGKTITGIGKIVRLVREVHARRLQIQELMARDICNDIVEVLGARGARAVLKAKHMCMCSRGPRDDNAMTEVVYQTGTLDYLSIGTGAQAV